MWSIGKDSMLPPQQVWVWSLIKELISCLEVKSKKKEFREIHFNARTWYFMLIIYGKSFIHSFNQQIFIKSLICAVHCNGKRWWFSGKRTVIRAKKLSSPLGRVLVNEELFMSSDSNVSSAFGKCWLNFGPEENYSHLTTHSQWKAR